MLNTLIQPEIGIIQIPNRYDLIQLIARKNGLSTGEYIRYNDGLKLSSPYHKK